VCAVDRVPTPPGKSWNSVDKISRTWKVLEILVLGPGKSWNLLGNEAYGVHNDVDADIYVVSRLTAVCFYI